MPGSTTVKHNGLVMTFDESVHSYTDGNNRRYTSVTTLVGLGFEKFDAVRIAKKKAGDDWQRLVDEWNEKGRLAAEAGTLLHENCERLILDPKNCVLHVGRNPEEEAKFSLAEQAVMELLDDSDNVAFEPEKLVFSPKLGLAGSVDLLVSRSDGTFDIYDWKNIKGIETHGFNGKTGILDCTKDLPDSNFWHYALQLQLYELIMKVEGYIPPKAKVRRTLNVFEKGTMNKYSLPLLVNEAKGLIRWNLNRKGDGLK